MYLLKLPITKKLINDISQPLDESLAQMKRIYFQLLIPRGAFCFTTFLTHIRRKFCVICQSLIYLDQGVKLFGPRRKSIFRM